MSYLVLARKWRPRTFTELSGQEHVVRALTNALTRNRLHHAYLLTGTRGVGKTTIARILAKSLNCETGVTAEPCGVCGTCSEIDGGRFVDLLELDAASNTGIDNMREILDNARYAPTSGRYKVYLIDEVHMLSKAAFNSMLKTLEEPPEHVKFVLATTDPQKIPVTVLSRCLQFNLKQLPPAVIVERLAAILNAEAIANESPALALIARAAQGSMRDALSLLDQAIAYGGGEVRADVVAAMLGAVDVEHVFRIADAVLARDGAALLAEADALAQRNLSAAAALEELASLYHRVATAQVVPTAFDALEDGERIAGYAARMQPEDVQLAYQICVQGRADLALAPDEAMALSMTLLRLLAFAPAGALPDEPVQAPPRAEPRPARAASLVTTAARTATPAASVAGASTPEPTMPRAAAVPVAPAAAPAGVSADLSPSPSTPEQPLPVDAGAWIALMASLKVPGMAGQLAVQSEWRASRGNEIVLALPEAQRHLGDRAYAEKLRAAVEGALGRKIRLTFEVASEASGSLAAKERRDRADEQARTEAQFRQEPFVQDVLSRFGASIRPDSIKPL